MAHNLIGMMKAIGQIVENRWAYLGLMAFGFFARLALASLGYNIDMRSWFTVADITAHGGNVYAETPFYNYGPVWFLLLQGLDLLALHHHLVLRYLVTGVLSLVDFGISCFLCQRVSRWVGVLFFLNPVSIVISGFYSQFDNLAILLGLWSVYLLGDDFDRPLNRRKLCGLLVLGLSLTTKHVLFLFPVWLAIKQKGGWQKIVVLLAPIACFLLSFSFYWRTGREGIIAHVFGYQSCQFPYFYELFLPAWVLNFIGVRYVWYGLLILLAFVCRARSGFESLLVYSGALLALSPAMENHFLAIPMALAVVNFNPLFAAYTAFSVCYLFTDVRNGPHLWTGSEVRIDRFASYALDCALLWLLWRPQWRQGFHWVRREIAIQLGR